MSNVRVEPVKARAPFVVEVPSTSTGAVVVVAAGVAVVGVGPVMLKLIGLVAF
jgi:hypothetical protein